MKICNSEAMKLIREYEDQKRILLADENRNCTMSYKENEKKLETDYDYNKTRKQVRELDEKIRKIKATLACANCSVKIDDFNITIGEALIMIAQLQNEKSRIEFLADYTQLSRRITQNGVLEYTECMFDTEVAKKDAEELRIKISKLQIAIDRANLTNYIEI